MPDQNPTPAEQESTNTLSDDQTMDQFQGFATKDGERVEPAAPPAADAPAAGDESGDDGATTTDDQEVDPAAAERHKSAQQRINKAVGRQRAAERRAEAMEAELRALQSRGPAPGTTRGEAAKPAPQGDTEAPKVSDYEYGELDAKYVRDLARHEARQELASSQQRATQERDNAQRTQAQQEFQQNLDGFLTKGLDIADDFEDIVRDEGFLVSQTLAELAMESDHGPQILYGAGSDPKEAKRISAMSPARQAAWFGQKEAELLSSGSSDAGDHSGPKSPPNDGSPKTTQAPPPPKGKAKGSGTAQTASPATQDFRQFERLAMKPQG